MYLTSTDWTIPSRQLLAWRWHLIAVLCVLPRGLTHAAFFKLDRAWRDDHPPPAQKMCVRQGLIGFGQGRFWCRGLLERNTARLPARMRVGAGRRHSLYAAMQPGVRDGGVGAGRGRPGILPPGMGRARLQDKSKRKKYCYGQSLGTMLSLDLADMAIIETMATARTITAMTPNSGIT